jgi:hypothetical protein
MAGIAEYIAQRLQDNTLTGAAIGKSIARVGNRKALLTA